MGRREYGDRARGFAAPARHLRRGALFGRFWPAVQGPVLRWTCRSTHGRFEGFPMRRSSFVLAALLALLALAVPRPARATLHAGDPAPDFRGTDLDGVSRH